MQIHLIHLSATPVDEIQLMYLRSFIALGHDLISYGNPINEDITHRPIEQSRGLFGSSIKKSLEQTLLAAKVGDLVLALDWESALHLPLPIAEKTTMAHLVTNSPIDANLSNTAIRKYKKRAATIPLIIPSNYLQEALRTYGIDARHMYVIPPAYISSELPPIEKHQSFVVGAVSPLEAGRGIEHLIQTVQENQEILPQLRVVIIGDGPEKRRLLWLISHLRLQHRVQLVANHAAYERFLVNFDVLICTQPQPQYYNPVLIHALGQKLPVIATNLGIHAELLEHGKSALLYEPANITMLSQHLVNLYNHPDWMQHYQKTGHALIKSQFGLDKFKKDFDSVYVDAA